MYDVYHTNEYDVYQVNEYDVYGGSDNANNTNGGGNAAEYAAE